MNKSKRKVFKQFLKDNEALDKFKAEVKDQYGESFKKYCSTVPYANAVTAIGWSRNLTYWINLDAKWEKQCITNS